MSTDIKETIAELDRISALVTRFYDIGDEIDELKNKNERETREVYYKYRPELPKGLPIFETLEPNVEAFQSSYTKGIIIGLLGFVVSLIILFISGSAYAFGIIGYSFFATIFFAIWFIFSYRKYAADKKEYDFKAQRRNRFNEIINIQHAQDLLRFQTDLDDYYTKYQLFDHKFSECFDIYVNEHNLFAAV